MVMDLNQVLLIGKAEQAPELKFTASGRAHCRLRVSTTEEWNQNGEKKSRTSWHNVVAWGQQAEACGVSVKKGTRVFVRGRIETRSYDDGTQKKWITEILADQVIALGGGDPVEEEVKDDVPF